MAEHDNVSHGHLDVLKEIGTMGAGRAATALSEIISMPVSISVPEARMIPSSHFAKVVATSDGTSFVLVIMLQGELGGRVFFLLSPTDARMLGASLTGQTPETIKFDDPLVQSSLKEALNIIVGAYMAALSELTGFEIMFSIPYLAMDILTAVFIAEQTPHHSSEMILIKTQMKIADKDFNGAFLFFPDMPSIKKIFAALHLDEGDKTSAI
jgi:chemotaxis protein CheC